ncbi:Formate efflux transporter (TC 2.A.44 family) [plant metagenome]|uniref:Formate efflux transporter (TC 2.A.44 family) n=1 Tax=plant metagenome TaxID=1297885 RepID=A0A484PXF5_9ZZZZ
MSQDTSLPSPPALLEEVFDGLAGKAALPPRVLVMLGMLAGAYIGLGGLFSTVALAGAEALPHGLGQVLAGAVFSLGLALVILAGAELFTGNMLFAGPVAAGRIRLGQAARALGIVYAANLLGSVALAGMAMGAGLHEAGEGSVGRAALALGGNKVGNGFLATFASGVLANMLVCLAVWLAAAGRTVTQKIAGLMLPVAAFVAAGLEHSVANMYLLPYAWMVQAASGDAGPMSLPAILGNLGPATAGNMVGGALVALVYWAAYGRQAG